VSWLGSSRPCAVTAFCWPRRGRRAALEHGGRVAEDEVDGAGHEALAVQVAERVRVQGVLVPVDAAAVGDGAVGAHAQRHRLVLRWPRRVLHPQVLQDDPVSRHGCMHHSQKVSVKGFFFHGFVPGCFRPAPDLDWLPSALEELK